MVGKIHRGDRETNATAQGLTVQSKGSQNNDGVHRFGEGDGVDSGHPRRCGQVSRAKSSPRE